MAQLHNGSSIVLKTSLGACGSLINMYVKTKNRFDYHSPPRVTNINYNDVSILSDVYLMYDINDKHALSTQ